MKYEDEKKYNVYIIKNDGVAVALIGSNLNEDRADKREMTGLMRIDRENYFVSSFEVGSVQDKKSEKQLAKIK